PFCIVCLLVSEVSSERKRDRIAADRATTRVLGRSETNAASRDAAAGAAKIRIGNSKYEKCGLSKACEPRCLAQATQYARIVSPGPAANIRHRRGNFPR